MYRDAPLTGSSLLQARGRADGRAVRALHAPAVRSVHRLRRLGVRTASTARARAPAACDRRRGEDRRQRSRPSPAASSSSPPAAAVRLRRRRARALCGCTIKSKAERCDRRATLEYDEALVGGRRSARRARRYRRLLRQVRRLVSAALGDLQRARAPRRARSRRRRGDPADGSTTRGPRLSVVARHGLRGAGAPRRRDPRLSAHDDAVSRQRIASRSTSPALLEQQGQFCEARGPILQFVQHHPSTRSCRTSAISSIVCASSAAAPRSPLLPDGEYTPLTSATYRVR